MTLFSSVAGHFIPHIPGFDMGLYPASKFAVTALTQGLTNELSDAKSKIKVSVSNLCHATIITTRHICVI